MLGMHGTVTANYAVHECDLLFAVGARFDDRVTGKLAAFAPQAKTIVHIDVDPAEIGKNVAPTIPIVGDAKASWRRWCRSCAAMEPVPGRTSAWLAQDRRVAGRVPAALRARRGHRRAAVRDRGDRPRHRAATPSSAPTWASTRCGRRSTTTTPGRGSGSAPAAWAPWASACRPRWAPRSAGPDKTVIDISGDGGFQMTMQELATA